MTAMTSSRKPRFGEVIDGPPSNTADVLSRPTQSDVEIARKAIEQVDLDVVCRDVGAVLAREYANVLERYAFKPADYAHCEFHKVLAKALVKELPSSEVLARAFQDQLRMRG